MAGKNNNKQKEKLFQDLDSCMERLEQSLEALKTSLDAVQVGDGNNPYWNGNNACAILKSCYMQHDTDQALLNYIKECKESTKR